LVEYLNIQGIKVPAVLKKNTRYTVRLIFKSGTLYIETHNGKMDEKIMGFVHEKSQWILKNYQKQRNQLKKVELVNQLPEGKVWLLGKVYEYEFRTSNQNFFRFQNQKIIIFTKSEQPGLDTVYDVLRAFSKKYLVQRTLELAKDTDLKPNQIRIKIQRSKWGSCSSQKNINLNWRLIFLEPTHIDYVIIHELCHLKHLNHSNLFWDLVETFCPYYRESEKHLKENQWILDIYKD
jgi:predicted metal-dependent hydrolase